MSAALTVLARVADDIEAAAAANPDRYGDHLYIAESIHRAIRWEWIDEL